MQFIIAFLFIALFGMHSIRKTTPPHYLVQSYSCLSLTALVYNESSCSVGSYMLNITGMTGIACRLVYPLDNSLYITGNCTGPRFRPQVCLGVCGHFGCSFQQGKLSEETSTSLIVFIIIG
jgi:hypothetical protein